MVMWVTLFLACFGAVYSSNSKNVISTDFQTVTDESNQDVKLDNARQPVTLGAEDGRDKVYDTQDYVSGGDQTIFYSNQWTPFITQTRSGYKYNPIFPRSSDSDPNKTETYNAIENDELPPTRLSSEPIWIYPQPVKYHPNENADENSPTSVTQLYHPDSVTSSLEGNPSDTSPYENSSMQPGSETSESFEFYETPQGLIPPRVAVYIPPYPALPFVKFQPKPVSNSNTEPGSETRVNASLRNEFSEMESHIVSDSMHVTESVLEDDIPSEISPDIVPLSLPGLGYPFGMVPIPPFVPPLVPNILPFRIPNSPVTSGHTFILRASSRGVTFNRSPFPESTHAQAEDQAADTLLPLTVTRSPLEPTNTEPQTDVTSQLDSLLPELDAPTDINDEAQNIFEEEKPTESIIPYEFGYDMNDGHGNDQHRKEESDSSGVVTGSYGYRDVFGVYRLVNYIADKDGFRASVRSNEPGVASSGSADVDVMAERTPQNSPIQETANVSESGDTVAEDQTSDLLTARIESESK